MAAHRPRRRRQPLGGRRLDHHRGAPNRDPCDANARQIPTPALNMTPPDPDRPNPRRAITDHDVERLAAEAEAGYDVDELIARRGRRGRPPIGTAAASVE